MRSVIRVCFVCLGNICRSPIAEGIFRRLVAEAELGSAFEVDSAGTAGYHAGEAPDVRARAAGQRAGFVVAGQARQFLVGDLARFDYVIAMDASNQAELTRLAGSVEGASKVRLLRSFDPEASPRAPIPDPYYGGDQDFDEVVTLCDAACRQLLGRIRTEHGL